MILKKILLKIHHLPIFENIIRFLYKNHGHLCHNNNVADIWYDILKFMMTSSNGNIFRITGPLCWNPPVTGGFPSQRPVMRSFDVFFDLRLNKRLSKQARRQWFDMPLHLLWHHCNDFKADQLWKFVKINVWSSQSSLAFIPLYYVFQVELN